MGVNWEGLGEGVIAFLKKSWTINQNVVNGEHFLLQIKKELL